jgi:hypothetical protein
MNRAKAIVVVLGAALWAVTPGCWQAPRGIPAEEYAGELPPLDVSWLDPLRRAWYAPESSPQQRVEAAKSLTSLGMTSPEVEKILGTPTQLEHSYGIALRGVDDPNPRRFDRMTLQYWFGQWVICFRFECPATNWNSDTRTWPLEEIYYKPTKALARPLKRGQWEFIEDWTSGTDGESETRGIFILVE